jgi:hypothetical protein
VVSAVGFSGVGDAVAAFELPAAFVDHVMMSITHQREIF